MDSWITTNDSCRHRSEMHEKLSFNFQFTIVTFIHQLARVDLLFTGGSQHRVSIWKWLYSWDSQRATSQLSVTTFSLFFTTRLYSFDFYAETDLIKHSLQFRESVDWQRGTLSCCSMSLLWKYHQTENESKTIEKSQSQSSSEEDCQVFTSRTKTTANDITKKRASRLV